MATVVFRGDATAVAQVTTATPTAANSTAYTLTINGKDITITSDASATVAEITAALVAAWNASTEIEISEVTATDSTTHVTLMADTAGKPFTVTSTGAGTLTMAEPTASSGPNHWDTAENWVGAAVPTTGDDVHIENSDVDILYGLAQSAVTLAALNISQSYTGSIGLPRDNASGYFEYRDTYLAVSATVLNIGNGDGSGSGRLKINTGSNATTITLKNSGTPIEQGVPAVLWKGTHASNIINAHRCSLGAAFFAGETATIATLRESFLTSVQSDCDIVLGDGCTLTTLDKTGGRLRAASNTTTLTQDAGETVFEGAATLTTGTIRGGTLQYNSSGTATTIVASNDATVDFSQDLRSKTVTNMEKYGSARVIDPHKVVTFTNGIDCHESGTEGLDIGRHIRITRGAVS